MLPLLDFGVLVTAGALNVHAEQDSAHVTRDGIQAGLTLSKPAQQERSGTRRPGLAGPPAQDFADHFVPLLVLFERLFQPGPPFRVSGECRPAHEANVQVLSPMAGKLAADEQLIDQLAALVPILIRVKAHDLIAGWNTANQV